MKETRNTRPMRDKEMTTPERPNVEAMKTIKALNTIADELHKIVGRLDDISDELHIGNKKGE